LSQRVWSLRRCGGLLLLTAALAGGMASSCTTEHDPRAAAPESVALHAGTLAEDRNSVMLAVPDDWDAAVAQERTWTAPATGTWKFATVASLARGARAPTVLRIEVDGVVLHEGNVNDRGRVSVDVPAGGTVRLTTDPGVLLGTPVLYRPEANPAHIVVVVVDTLRADHLGAFGYPRPTSPQLDQIAAAGVWFSRALAPAPWTLPSTRAIVSGQHPWDWTSDTATFMTHLREAGWATAAITRNPWLDERNGVPRGANFVDARARVDAAEDVARAQAWLQDESDRSGVLLLHLMDPHAPYSAPGPVPLDLAEAPPAGPTLVPRKQILEDAYDAEIRYTDAAIGNLAATIAGLPGRTLLVVTSDHGEEFWEHGGVEHGHSLHGEVLHVPLILRGTDVPASGDQSAPVTLMDVAPTVLAWAGADVAAASMAGRNLLADSLPDGRPMVIGEAIAGTEAIGVAVEGERYWLQGGTEHRYATGDLTDTQNLAPVDAVVTATWRERLRTLAGYEVREGAVLAIPVAARDARPDLSTLTIDVGVEVLESRVSRADGYLSPSGVTVSHQGNTATLALPPGESAGITVSLAAPARLRVSLRTSTEDMAHLRIDRPRPRVQLGDGDPVPIRLGAGPVAWPLEAALHPAGLQEPMAGPAALRAIGYIQ
jgi:hypothetical protein